MAGAVELVLVSFDMQKNEIRNFKPHVLATDPTGLVAGDEGLVWYNSTDNAIKFWDGSAVQVLWKASQHDTLASLTDTTITTPSAGHVLRYDGSKWVNVAQSSLDHGSLGGLGDDDHTIYLKADGTRALSGALSMGGFKLTNLGTPTADTDAVNKAYADSLATGLDVKPSVKVATTANITLSGTQTIDGVSVVAGDRVLVKDQTTASGNGIYVVASGAWTRATDADSNAEVTPGMFVFVEQGTVNGDTGWVLTTDGAIVLGTTSLSFTKFSSAGEITNGDGIAKSGNILSLNIDTAFFQFDASSPKKVQLKTGIATAGTYAKVTVDAYGRVTAGTTLSASDIPSLDVSKITTGTLAIARGGTGNTSFTSGKLVKYDGTKLSDSSVTETDVADAVSKKHSHIGGNVGKYSETLATSATSYTITHNLGTEDVEVIVRSASGSKDRVRCGVEVYDANTVKLYFSVAPSASAYRVTVIG